MRMILIALAALTVTTTAVATPPRAGVLVPGKRLGGLELGATRARATAVWGRKHGVCRDCRIQTWYFNLRPLEPQGVGVSFRRGRAVALFTVWGPQDWRTNRGLGIGDPAARIAGIYGALLRTTCGNYSAFTLRRGKTITSFYVVNEQVWGFGLSLATEPVCH